MRRIRKALVRDMYIRREKTLFIASYVGLTTATVSNYTLDIRHKRIK
jgi:predicted transcriptional regulator